MEKILRTSIDKFGRGLKSFDRSEFKFLVLRANMDVQIRIRSDSKPITTTNESSTAITRTFFSRSFGLPASLIEWNRSRSDSGLT